MVAQVMTKSSTRQKRKKSKAEREVFVPQQLNTRAYAPRKSEETTGFEKPQLNFSERSRFYTCIDRKTLRDASIRRVRELEDLNDMLQREIVQFEEELSQAPSDVPTLLAMIEHKKAMIARNTGEVLKIFIQEEERAQRIAELEAHNKRLEKEIAEKQSQWERTHDHEARIRISSVLLLNREKINYNLAELVDLRRL